MSEGKMKRGGTICQIMLCLFLSFMFLRHGQIPLYAMLCYNALLKHLNQTIYILALK